MSGTSLDGVDGVIADFSPDAGGPLRVRGHVHRAFAAALATELLALNTPGENEIHRAALAGNALAGEYAAVVESLLGAASLPRDAIRAIGVHGQTVRHRPREFDGIGYTVQLNQPALLAERVGIDVIADIRTRDVAAGGQGAPLVPAFHRAAFGQAGASVAVLNVGGISNLTALRADGSVLGLDCGPGNALLDHWCLLHTGHAYDDGGRWGATGQVDATLLTRLRSDPYFALALPKSTGRDRFNAHWLAAHLAGSAARPVDVQATLTELTAAVCASEVATHASDARELLVCGGGARNDLLMRRLGARLPGVTVLPTDARGLPADQVEACAFAWLARAFVRREAGNLPSVTGAAGSRLLGALYPAG
ncbi:MAG: anhydro-N-acetylmuramic acid kinase [Pseudomonadota bacterium]|nr:anhydro-N-acetylmuramic acid kinase [Pseudomonadota bacterium]